MRGKCNRCDGRGYKKLPLGTYGMIKCPNCNGSGKDPVEAVKEACKRALGLNTFNNRAELQALNERVIGEKRTSEALKSASLKS